MGIYQFTHENRLGLSTIGLIIGFPLTLVSILSILYSDGDTGLLKFSYDLLDVWAFWFIIPGLLLLSIGTYYVYDFFRNLKKFKSLIDIESKAIFIKKMDKIEELAWRLHPKYERIVIEKKKKYKIK